MPVIPYVWSGLSRETRRQIEHDERAQGNQVAWIRLVVQNHVPTIDIVSIQGVTQTQNTGLMCIDQDLVFHAACLPCYLVGWQYQRVLNQLRNPERPRIQSYQVRVEGLLGVTTSQPLVNPAEVTDRLKRLVEIDIRGVLPQAPVVVEPEPIF